MAFALPAVRQVMEEGLDVPAGVTLLVGENGSGKSTLVEAVAAVHPRRGAEARAWGNQLLLEQSHGESFLTVLRYRFSDIGFYLLDEPESALSFRSCLALVALLHDLAGEGSQVLCATHSPLIASLPGRRCWRSATTASGRWSTTSSTSCATGATSSPRPTATCATFSAESRLSPPGPTVLAWLRSPSGW